MRTSLLLLLTCLAGNVSAEQPPLNEQSVAAFFDAAFSVQQQDHEIAGMVVSVVYDGAVVFKGGYGFADIEQRTAADPEQSLFRIASISKPFIWIALMQMREQGLLTLEDKVEQHLDFSIPATFDEPIRIKHLLTHTPGFEEKGTGTTARERDAVLPLRTYLIGSMPARVRPPGTHASYSNYGAALAGYIVERISGQTWSNYVEQHILAPLAMTSTNSQLDMKPELKASLAKGYWFRDGEFQATPYDFGHDGPAGLMSTTADDMTRFMLAILNDGAYTGGRILSPESMRIMRQPLFDIHPAIAPMLHGFYRFDRAGLEIFGHGGDTNQFHSNLAFIPQKNLGLFVSFNSDPAAAARSNIVTAFVDHFFGQTYLRQAPNLVAVSLDDYVGTYIPLRSNLSTFEKLATLVSAAEISTQNDEIVLSARNTSRWVATGEDQLTGKYTEHAMVFQRDTDGVVTHMTIGTPLATFRRVSGLNSPNVQQQLVVILLVLSLLTIVAYISSFWRRASEPFQLPQRARLLACIHAFLVVGLYIYLFTVLSGDVNEFAYGVPPGANVAMHLMSLNILIGIGIIFFAVRAWTGKQGNLNSRAKYSTVAISTLINIYFCWTFNIMTYPFQG